jgi:hypothetical protein
MLFRFHAPHLLLAALCGVALIAATAWLRRIRGSPLSKMVALAGVLFWAFAAGGLTWRVAKPQAALVMIDNSPSTRTAAYRDASFLARRINQLLGDTPYRTLTFGEGVNHTIFSPPPAAAILLFSDGRFDLPENAPPTYPVVDPNLEHVVDAAITRLDIRDRQLVADVTVTGPPRQLTLHGTAATQPITVGGRRTILQPLDPHASFVYATFSAGDAWPENDAMSIPIAPPAATERWWIGSDVPPGFRSMTGASLPIDSSAYLAPSVIILNNQPATAFSSEQLQRLTQYVRDLGGSLVMLGGDHAFAAGNYLGTPLETLSPLASAPPKPETDWIILVDSSGSMGTGGQWQSACDAVNQLLHHLPEHDLILLGSFAEQLTWWNAATDVRTAMRLPIPPPNISPHGPTNLQQALQSIIDSRAQAMVPRQLILITDADVQLDHPAQLGAALKAASIHLNLLAIGHGRGFDALQQFANVTVGHVVETSEQDHWTDDLQSLSQSVMPNGFQAASLKIVFLPPLALPSRSIDQWNPAWIKSDATPLADVAAQSLHPVATWHFGSGTVTAAAFSTDSAEALALANQIAQSPADPRFTVEWKATSKLTVTIDAHNGSRYLNDEHLTLKIQRTDFASTQSDVVIPQSAPGRYEVTVDAPRDGGFASVEHDNRTLSRLALPTRYPPEFDAVGNDHANMHALADRTGGQVIDIRQATPIHFHWPESELPLDGYLATLGALLIAMALIHERLK